jgi:hypothetical protein
VRQLARLTHPSRSTLYRRLTQKLGFPVRHLGWVPHRLSYSQKSKYVELSEELLSILKSQKRRVWHNIVTLDESWLYFRIDHELISLQPSEEAPERERLAIQSEKTALIIVQNPIRFHVVSVLGNGRKFKAAQYMAELLWRLAEWRRNQVGASD